jgi:succinoglycan biosynthesis transport protein ExoP
MSADQDNEGVLNIYPREIIAALYRKRFWLIPTLMLGLVVATATILLQKPEYRSTTTLLIDSQQIPTTIVASPLANIANERIAKIRQQVLSHHSLSLLIKDNKLFPKEQKKMPIEDVEELVENSIKVDLVGTDTGRMNNGGSTIAFLLSFTYSDPVKAQAVTRQLANIFLAEDKRFRTEQATGTAAFLGRRADELRRQLSALEGKRREVEARYAGALPDHVALSAQSNSALRAEVSRIDAESQGLSQQASLLAARADEDARTPPGIEELRRAEERLNQLTAIYADDYPDVVAARAAVERQRASLRRSQSMQGASVIQREIASSHARTSMLAARRGELVQSIAEMERRSAQAPQAAYELNMIEREYDNIRRQYETLREKQLDAQVAVTLQSENKGERFSVIDAPNLPHHRLGVPPVMTLLTGLIAGLVFGVGAILTSEWLAGSIHGADTLTRLLNAPPLGIVPVAHRPRPFHRVSTWVSEQKLPERLHRLTQLFSKERNHAG